MGRIYKALRLKNNGKDYEVVAFVDSGSDNTIISKRIAKLLKIIPIGKEDIEVANREIMKTEVGRVRVFSSIDNINDEIRVNITDEPFKNDIDENIDMIIGVDFLQKHNVKLSFRM